MEATLLLSRLQFAAATIFHFIFVPLTLGLSVLVAWMETKYVRTGDEDWRRMAKFYGKLFLINFALGVVTGITLEFQFGTNWSKYSAYMGDIFGALLAIEATAAFFLESTFVGVWAFGWKKLSPRAHMICAWLVAGASNLSAIWILIANGFMQNPVGYEKVMGPMGEKLVLSNFWDVMFNPFAWLIFFHIVAGALAMAGFFVLGVAAIHLLRQHDSQLFGKAFRLGAAMALVFSLVVALEGHFHGNEVANVQPAKLAAMEAHWETKAGAPMYLLQIPGDGEDLLAAFPVPKLLSFLAYNDPNAVVKGLNDFPAEDIPPVALTFYSFRIMVGLGTLMILIAAFAWIKRNNIQKYQWFLNIAPWFIPIPYLAMEAGWIVAEVGRQPWIVYGLMRTSEAASPVASSQVSVSLFAFVLIYSLLGFVGIWLMTKYAKQGPEAA
ncbi:MAG: cytochrome ubiquinol oxidase subunit I [Desulfovibrionaceae bacterium]